MKVGKLSNCGLENPERLQIEETYIFKKRSLRKNVKTAEKNDSTSALFENAMLEESEKKKDFGFLWDHTVT